MEFSELLITQHNPMQIHALVFLLGSLTVSSLSDLRRMAAQADFAEVWAAYTIVLFSFDVYLGLTAQMALAPFMLKWVLIVVFAAVTTGSHSFSISTMDVAAIIALLATLNPVYILITLPMLVLVNELLKPILSKYGEAGAYPFLPTVLAANLILLLIFLAGGIEPYLGLAAPMS